MVAAAVLVCVDVCEDAWEAEAVAVGGKRSAV